MAEQTPVPAQRVPPPRLAYVDRHGAELPPAPHSWPPSEPPLPSQQLHGYPGNGPPAAAAAPLSPMQPPGPMQNGYPPPAPAMGPTCPWPTAGPTQSQHAPSAPSDSRSPTANGQPRDVGSSRESRQSAGPQPAAPGSHMHADSQQHPRSHPMSSGPDPQQPGQAGPAGPQGPFGNAPAQPRDPHPPAAVDGHQRSQSAADQECIPEQGNASLAQPAHDTNQQAQATSESASSQTEQHSIAAAQGWPLQYPMEYPSSAAGQAHDRWQQQRHQSEHMQGTPVGGGARASSSSSSARVAGYASLGYGAGPPAAPTAAASLWLDNGHGYLWNQQTGQWATVNPIPPLQTPLP